MFQFEKLDAWQKAVELATIAYRVTRQFPDDERFGLTSKMRRAAVSISSNIAEGTSRASKNDFARFVEIAYGSLSEVISQAQIARLQGFLSEQNLSELTESAERLARMLSGLRASLLNKES